VGFDAESRDAGTALDALLARGDVDRTRVVLVGRGAGAALAALAADGRGDVAGVAGWGLQSRPLLESYIAATRHQQAILGTPPTEAGAFVDVLARTLGLIISGVAPDECRELVPESSPGWDENDRFNAKAQVYWRERNAADVVPAWTRVRGPVLLLRGEHDVSSLPEEYVLLSRALEDARHPAFAFEELPGLDFDLGRVASAREAVRRYAGLSGAEDRSGEGAADLAERLVGWIRRLPPTTPPAGAGP
jgi:dienelactone hydrolase